MKVRNSLRRLFLFLFVCFPVLLLRDNSNIRKMVMVILVRTGEEAETGLQWAKD